MAQKSAGSHLCRPTFPARRPCLAAGSWRSFRTRRALRAECRRGFVRLRRDRVSALPRRRRFVRSAARTLMGSSCNSSDLMRRRHARCRLRGDAMLPTLLAYGPRTYAQIAVHASALISLSHWRMSLWCLRADYVVFDTLLSAVVCFLLRTLRTRVSSIMCLWKPPSSVSRSFSIVSLSEFIIVTTKYTLSRHATPPWRRSRPDACADLNPCRRLGLGPTIGWGRSGTYYAGSVIDVGSPCCPTCGCTRCADGSGCRKRGSIILDPALLSGVRLLRVEW